VILVTAHSPYSAESNKAEINEAEINEAEINAKEKTP
jgi:hypothetical protein